MRKILLSALAVAGLLFMPVQARAQVEQYDFDKAHTQIVFFVNHLGFSNSMGKFLDWDGHYILDRDNPENSRIDVTIHTASIEMNDERWNNHMKNEDFFDVENYPHMTFKSTNVEVTGEDTARVTGDLTLLGQTHPVVLDVVHNKSDYHPMRSEVFVSGFSATGSLKRSEFGMDYGLPLVGDEVRIVLEVEGFRRDPINVVE